MNNQWQGLIKDQSSQERFLQELFTKFCLLMVMKDVPFLDTGKKIRSELLNYRYQVSSFHVNEPIPIRKIEVSHAFTINKFSLLSTIFGIPSLFLFVWLSCQIQWVFQCLHQLMYYRTWLGLIDFFLKGHLTPLWHSDDQGTPNIFAARLGW
jgi:hypothetical protein